MAKRSAKAAQKNQPGRLRIVAGNWRSRLLDIADVPGLRPTSERVRETLFNWLAPRIARARVLDLFAGTGALGLEALSRGAAETVFVESSSVAVATLRKNVAALAACSAHIKNTDAFDYLQRSTDAPFDVVFLDPPFAADNLDELCRLLAKSSLLAANAWVYLEEDRARVPVTLPDGWRRLKTKQAGNVRYSLVEAAADA
jgi:16S rRNA (guanine966-N2)-methyltransferase